MIFTNPVIKDDTRRKVATAFRNVGKEGVLVLSSFAGVAAEMAEALLINPFDQERRCKNERERLMKKNNSKQQSSRQSKK